MIEMDGATMIISTRNLILLPIPNSLDICDIADTIASAVTALNDVRAITIAMAARRCPAVRNEAKLLAMA